MTEMTYKKMRKKEKFRGEIRGRKSTYLKMGGSGFYVYIPSLAHRPGWCKDPPQSKAIF
jgi:hypothetical protein